MKNGSARPTNSTTRQTTQQDIFGHLEKERPSNFQTHPRHHFLKRFRLRYCSGEPVKDKLSAIQCTENFLNHANHHFIWDQRTTIHITLSLQAKKRLVLHRLTKQITGTDMLHALLINQQRTLSALASAWGTKKDDAQY
jgi:hypothetical protein